MSTYTNNGTITSGGTGQDAVAAGHAYLSLVFNNESADDMRVKVDGTATSSVGEKVYANTSITLTNLCGRNVSVYGPTTSDAYSYREAL